MSLLQIRISPERHKQLKQLALDRDTTVSKLIRTWLDRVVKASVKKGEDT